MRALPLDLRASLVAAFALVLFAGPVPEAHAGGNVQLGSRSFFISVNAAGVAESKSGNGLTFTDSLTKDLVGVHAASTQNATVVDAAQGVSIDADPSTNCSSTNPDSNTRGQASSNMSVSYTVTAPTPYTYTLTQSGANGGSVARGGGVFAPGGFAQNGSFEGSGTLQPASYQLELNVGCSAGNFDPSGSGSASLSLQLGSTESVAIGSGPSGTVASTSAQFDFVATDPTPPPGQFECRLDDFGFASCISPKTFTSLPDGLHTFQVRYHPDGESPGPPTSRSWTVDTTAPAAVIDSAPTGSGNGPDASISFHSTEPTGASFRCKLDSGAEVDCSSPHILSGLADGPHTFSVKAIDAVGNVSVQTSTSWTVSPGAGPAAAVCAGGGASTGFGPVRLVARAADACFIDASVDGRPAKVSVGQVTLNGITLTPASGTRIIVSSRLGDGTVRTDGPVTVVFGPPPIPGATPPSVSLPSLALDSLGTSVSGVSKVLSVAEGVLELAKMKAAPGLTLELSADNGGQVKVTFRLTLPTVAFKALPGSPEGVTVEFSPTFSNDRGVEVGGRIKLAQVFLFGQKIKDLDVAYDHGTGVFDGSFGIALGEARTGRAEPTFTASIAFGPNDSPCQLRRIGLQTSNLNRHIGQGVFLQRYGGTFECASDGGDLFAKLAANAGVSAGPRIAIESFETEALSVDGTATLTIPVTGGPFTFDIKGVGKIVDFPVSEQTITYKPPATIKVTGTLDLTIGGYGVQLTYGELGSFVSEDTFNIEASGTANVFGFEFASQAVYSSTGFAVCFGPPDDRVGFGRRWVGGEGLTAFVVCDVGPFRATTAANAAQSGTRSFTVPKDRAMTVIAAEGTGAPPKVVVAGPSGERITTPAGPEGLKTKTVLLVQDPVRKTTFVVLFRPAAGRWTMSTAAGSPAPARLRLARGLPPLRIAAKVSGRGARRVLSWRASGLAGQRMQLVERSGGAANLLATTKKSVGKLRFSPDPRLGQKRTIEAIALNGGTPRSSSTVARYRVAPPARPARVRALKLRKRLLTWKAQRGIARYEIALTLPNGTTTSHTARRAQLKLPRLPTTGRLRVSILGVDVLGRTGPLTKASLTLK